jgi:carboxyl-terminal processing protease
MPKGIGYVRLTQVGKRSPEEMKAALEDLTTRGLRALILDGETTGRFARGGRRRLTCSSSGPILKVKSRNGEQVTGESGRDVSRVPDAVLVNRMTASAAEIIAACLQDHHRATIVGERTFGQGVVRSLFPLQGGAGALKLPVAVYYRPSGKGVNRYPGSADSDDWGVSPDAGFEVIFRDEEAQQLLIRRSERDRLEKPAVPTSGFSDRQLQKALECILAQSRQK